MLWTSPRAEAGRAVKLSGQLRGFCDSARSSFTRDLGRSDFRCCGLPQEPKPGELSSSAVKLSGQLRSFCDSRSSFTRDLGRSDFRCCGLPQEPKPGELSSFLGSCAASVTRRVPPSPATSDEATSDAVDFPKSRSRESCQAFWAAARLL